MARARNIKPAFFLNEELAKVSFQARLLFIGLWCLADCEGRLEDRPMRIKASLFPYDGLDIDQLLNELATSQERFIIRYGIGSSRYIQVRNFTKHQNPAKKERETGSRIPAYSEQVMNQFDPGTVPEPIQNGTGSADILIPDIPYTDSLKQKLELDASASVCVDVNGLDEQQEENLQLAQEGMAYLVSLNSPNHCNIGWVKGYLSIQFQELEQSKPNLRKPDIIACWREACDLAVAKSIAAPKWLKTTFQNKLDAWTPEPSKTPALGSANGQALGQQVRALLEFPFIRHVVTSEIFSAEDMEIRSDSPNGLTDRRGNYYPAGHLEGLTEVLASA